MKKNILSIIAIIVLLFAAIALKSLADAMKKVDNPTPSSTALPTDIPNDSPVPTPGGGLRVRGPEEVTLKFGETKEAVGVIVDLQGLVEDSRCPVEVVCIQAGRVRVSANITAGGTTTATILSSDSQPIEFAGYNISIVNVSPAKIKSSQITMDLYEVTFLVAPLGVEPLPPANPGEPEMM